MDSLFKKLGNKRLKKTCVAKVCREEESFSGPNILLKAILRTTLGIMGLSKSGGTDGGSSFRH